MAKDWVALYTDDDNILHFDHCDIASHQPASRPFVQGDSVWVKATYTGIVRAVDGDLAWVRLDRDSTNITVDVKDLILMDDWE